MRNELVLALSCLLGIVITRSHDPAVFKLINDFTITSPDTDTLEVLGTRVPGGEGIWRYHVHADRWEEIPSRQVQLANNWMMCMVGEYELVGERNHAAKDQSEHYYLKTWSDQNKREIFRTIGLSLGRYAQPKFQSKSCSWEQWSNK